MINMLSFQSAVVSPSNSYVLPTPDFLMSMYLHVCLSFLHPLAAQLKSVSVAMQDMAYFSHIHSVTNLPLFLTNPFSLPK